MKKKMSMLLITMLTITTILAGCGNKEKTTSATDPAVKTTTPVTVSLGFWGTAQDLGIYQQAVKDISAVHPNIKLEIKQYPSSEQFWNTLPGEIAAGVAPDLIKLTNEGAFEYIDKGLFEPLDELIKPAGVDLSLYNGVDIWKVDGKQYALPISTMPAMFLINEDMWKEAGLGEYPKTWDEVQVAAKQLTTKDVHGIVINIDAFHITNYVKSYGGDWGYGKTINSPENVKAVQKILDMYKDGSAVTPKSIGYGWDGEVFANKKAVMTTGGYWYKGYLKEANPDLHYVAFPVPEGTVHNSTMHSDGYVVLKDGKNKVEALQTASFLTSEKVLTEFVKVGNNPSLKSLSSKFFEVNPEFDAVKPAIEYSTDFQYPIQTKKFIDELIKQLEGTILGGNNKSAQEILDKVQEQFK